MKIGKHYKNLIALVVLTGAIGCKVKQTGTKTSAPSVEVAKKSIADEELYPLPEDDGKFKRFDIKDINEYIDQFGEIAQYEMKAFGIPASITLAQGLLESGYGQGDLAKKSNNHFGIKCHSDWKGDTAKHTDDAIDECFRKYNHPMYSYRDHSLFLTNRARYNFLFDYKTTNYNGWAKGLLKAGYATDRKYAQKLINLIEKHQLYKYDRSGLNAMDLSKVVEKPGRDTVKSSHTVVKGDTLYSIATKFNMTVDELKNINKMDGDVLSLGQVLLVNIEL